MKKKHAGRWASLDVLILGGGAAGLVCALGAARRGLRVLVLEQRPRVGDRLSVAGGGMVNLTNQRVGVEDFVCGNPRFLNGPLKAVSPERVLAFFANLGIHTGVREHGQLFTREGGGALRQNLLQACLGAGVRFQTGCRVDQVERRPEGFVVQAGAERLVAPLCVLALGGLARPGLGGSDQGCRLARDLGHSLIPTAPGLVPLLLRPAEERRWVSLAGVSLPAACRVGRRTFQGELLFAHQALSGPLILTVSNHWETGQPLFLDFLPTLPPGEGPLSWREETPRQTLRQRLKGQLPRSLQDSLLSQELQARPFTECARRDLEQAGQALRHLRVEPRAREGYARAEVMRGGVDTRQVDPRTMQSRLVPGLFLLGELLDVTGNLGGYNLHWAWASALLCAESLILPPNG